jgi:hypothetical protein
VNWSQMNVWAPARKLAATLRGRTAAPQRVSWRNREPSQSKVEPTFNRWHEYEPADPRSKRAQSLHSTQSEKVNLWRRRVLLKKGARLFASLGEGASRGSLAILDEFGMVVAWYERGRSTSSDEAIGKHLTQFYIPTDIADAVPAQHLSAAAISGSHAREGWRRHIDGRIYWGMTVIAPISMRNGKLQGYSHLTEESEAPWSGPALNSIRSRIEEPPAAARAQSDV